MIIENLARIIQGDLLNKPSINAITNITASLDKVGKSSAYFAYEASKDDIEEAILRGAYAVIFSGDLNFKDKEIAHIKVASVQDAMFRLMRYEIDRKELNFVYCDSLQVDMLKSFKFLFEAYVEPNMAQDFFALIFSMNPSSYLFSSSKRVLEIIAPNHKSIKSEIEAKVLQSHTLFRSSFAFKDNYFKEFALTPLFINSFCAIIDFLDENSLPYKVEALDKTGHFEPHFVNSAMRPKPFGSTHQALIIETNEKLYDKEVEFIKKYATSEQLLLLAPYSANITSNARRYTSASIIQTIGTNSFRYLLILGDKKQIIEALEAPPPPPPSLF
ncbi:MAG: hypothetical protein ACK5LP_06270 [Campylobacteraceae bacterium]